MAIVVRSANGDSLNLAPAVRHTVRELDSVLPLPQPVPVENLIREAARRGAEILCLPWD
jgi:hypothetical protein